MDSCVVAIAIGLIVSLLFTEWFGLSSGGMIVPGYFALHLHQPLSILITIVAGLLTWGLVRALAQVAILYGRRRIVMMVLVGFLVGSLLRMLPGWAAPLVAAQTSAAPAYQVIGFIIPGLIALWMDRQGWLETLAPLLTASVVVRLALILVGMEILV